MDREEKRTQEKEFCDKILNKYWILVMVVALAYNFGLVIMDNSVILYGTSLGYSNVKASLFTSMFSVAAIIFRILAGVLSDRKGRRYTMLIGCVIYAVSVYLFGIIPAFGIMVLMRFLNGAGFGLSSVSAGAASTDVIPQEKIKTASALFYVPMALAYVLCGYIVLFFTNRSMFVPLYYTNTAILAVGFLAALFCTYEKKRPQAAVKELNSTYRGWECFFEKKSLPCMSVGLLMSVSISLCTTFILKYASEANISQAGSFFTIMGVVMLIFNLTCGYMVSRLGRIRYLVTLFCFFGIVVVLMGVTGIPAFFFLLAAGLGMLCGGCTPALFSIAADQAPEGRRGIAISTFLISNDIGIAVGAVMWGGIIDRAGYSAAFALDGAVIVAALVLSVILFRKKRINPSERR